MTKSMATQTRYWFATSVVCSLCFGCGWIDLSGEQGVGQPCDLGMSVEPSQGAYNYGAIECASKLCLKPTAQPGAASYGPLNTGPTCSAECTENSDCDGEVADPNNPADTRCKGGFVCGIPFVKGALCCKRLCVCKDLVGPAGEATPIACQGAAAATCLASPDEPVAPGVEQVTDAYIDVSPVRQLDLVTMVDNSPNMAPKVAKLNAAFPKLIEALKNPLDGTLPDLRVAIIDSDLGTAGAYRDGPCAAKTLSDRTQSIFGDLGRFQMLSSPTVCPFAPGAQFLEHRSGFAINYTGDISTVFSCLTSNLGTAGCFQEHPLQAFEFALAAQGVGNEVQQLAFLRRSAQLGLIFLTDEDDCSAATNDSLFGDLPEARGESASLRCATRAHSCNGRNLATVPPGYPTTVSFSAPFSACQARIGDWCGLEGVDTSRPTSCNPLRDVTTFAQEIFGLRDDPKKQILVAGIFGWPRSDADMALAEYKIAPVPNPNTADTLHPTIFDYWPVCYDPNHLPSPATTDPATGFDATAAAWGATGGLRESAFIDQFGANGMKFSICEPDFSPAMATIGKALVERMQNLCFDHKLIDVDPVTPGVQADCRVVWRFPMVNEKTRQVVYQESPTSLPQCPPGATNDNITTDCWQIVADATQCPNSGQRVAVLRMAQEILEKPQLDFGAKIGMQCRTCPALYAASPAQAGCDY